jgi:hypothetical protein
LSSGADPDRVAGAHNYPVEAVEAPVRRRAWQVGRVQPAHRNPYDVDLGQRHQDSVAAAQQPG